MPSIPQARLSVVAEFPRFYFLENLAVRSDGSILVTAMNRKALWWAPAPVGPEPVKPKRILRLDLPPLFIVEERPDVFLLGASDVYGDRESRLYRIDLNGWTPGEAITPALVLEFPPPRVGLNGACLVAPNVLLAAGVAELIWRIDLKEDGCASARIWLRHDTLKNRPGEMKPEQPGVNGVRYAAETGYLYYTSTSQQLLMRVKVDAETFEPAGLPEFIAGGRQWDDFILDEAKGCAYVTTHRENTIDRVRLQPDGNREGRSVIAGDPFTELLIGPSSGAWRPGDVGRAAYIITDGGTAKPPDGVRRRPKILLFEP